MTRQLPFFILTVCKSTRVFLVTPPSVKVGVKVILDESICAVVLLIKNATQLIVPVYGFWPWLVLSPFNMGIHVEVHNDSWLFPCLTPADLLWLLGETSTDDSCLKQGRKEESSDLTGVICKLCQGSSWLVVSF